MNEERLMKILLAPHVSEKSNNKLGGYWQYAFKVLPEANKVEVKKAIQYLFGVDVKHVRMVNVKSKFARYGKTMGSHKAWKKAYVTLASGQEIDIAASKS